MNYRLIVRTLGFILLFEGVFLLVPALTAVVFWEKEFFSNDLTYYSFQVISISFSLPHSPFD